MTFSPQKPPPSTQNDALITKPSWTGPEDARKQSKAGTYPNYHEFKTRSGHTMIYDDSNGHEAITLQHRGGSLIQMMPDGAVQIVTHNGQYNIVFGENRMLVTGAHDLTVHGTASMMVEGDFNTTIRGNHNTTVDGDMNITAKNMNTTVRGNIETAAKSLSMKIEGNGMMTTQGNFYIAGHGDMMMGSLGGSVGIGAAQNVGVRAVGGEVAIQSEGDTSIKSDGGMILQQASSDISMKSGGDTKLQTSGKFSIKSGGIFAVDGSQVQLNSGMSDSADSAKAAADITEAKKSTQPTKEQNYSTNKADYISA